MFFYCEVICVNSRKENYRGSHEAKNLSVSFLQIRKKLMRSPEFDKYLKDLVVFTSSSKIERIS